VTAISENQARSNEGLTWRQYRLDLIPLLLILALLFVLEDSLACGFYEIADGRW
jgi:hypothetical protein